MKKLIIIIVAISFTVFHFSCKKEIPLVNVQQIPVKENIPPTAFAGADQTVYLPDSTVQLTGYGIDFDGSIVSFRWTNIYGPSEARIESAAQPKTIVKNLIAGTYQLEFTVTDNKGAKANDTVMITVMVNPNPPKLDTLYTDWFSIDTIQKDPDLTYFWTLEYYATPMNYNVDFHTTLSYVKRTEQGNTYSREIMYFDVPDPAAPEPFKFFADFGSSDKWFGLEGGSADHRDPPLSATLTAMNIVKNSQYRVIVIPKSTYNNNSAINWNNYLEVVAALNISP